MRLRVGAVLHAAVRRDVLVERRLAGRREFRELEAVAAIAAVAAAAAAAEAVGVRRPDACQFVGIERQIRVEEFEISGPGGAAASLSGRRRTAPALLSARRRGQQSDIRECRRGDAVCRHGVTRRPASLCRRRSRNDERTVWM